MPYSELNRFRKLLPIGISTLENIIKGGYVYVDKTKHIARMKATGGKYFFLSRPRRFGKSLFIDTLKQAFLGRRDLFEGLYLDRENSWNWNEKYPVIHFSFGGGFLKSKFALELKINELLDYYYLRYQIENKYDQINGRFNYLLAQVAEKNGPSVVLIDEYDKPILDNIAETDVAKKMREELKDFYSVIKDNDENLKFVMLTGVSKFSRVSLFSGLNNLEDITLNSHYADICGCTQSELEENFSEYLKDGNVDKSKLKLWYNGYSFGETEEHKVYNPFDILLFFSNNYQYRAYWFETGTPSFLIKLIKEKNYFLPDLENITASEELLLSFDVEENIDFITLLFQAGYLTISKITTIGAQFSFELCYPNLEVKASLNNSIISYLGNSNNKNACYFNLSQALLQNNFTELKNIFTSHFAGIPYNWYVNNNIKEYEGFYASVVYSYFAALGYKLIGEDVTNHGRIDLTMIMPDKVIIIEFKLAKYGSAKDSIHQMRAKKYAAKYLDQNIPIHLLAIIFDSENRNVMEVISEELKITQCNF